MWKVSNRINERYLLIFHDKIILLLFKFMKDPTINEVSCKKETIESYTDFSGEEKEILKILFRKQKIREEVKKILEKYSKKQIIGIERYYLYLWRKINLKNYNVIFYEVVLEIKEIFIYFFEICFNCDFIWKKLLNCEFSKDKFLENFKRENELTICPYCDIADISLPGNSFIDHFLPKAKFPLLSMHSYNLIPICGSCNGPYGKSSDYKKNIYGLYEIQMGDKINFIINHPKSEIELETEDIKIQNYIGLLKLESKYSIDEIYTKSLKKIKGLYDIIGGVDNLKEVQLLNYLTENEKSEQLYFLNKNMVNSYLKYKDSLRE